MQNTPKIYLLVLLTIIMVFNYVDRVALGLLLPSIKADLGLTDTQLGLLTGIAFAGFYAVMGIPLGRWADRGNRATIIALTTALWSVAVALSGRATSFAQLLAIRAGVATGEAGCHPPALSLISDYFTQAERPRAVALYMLGWPLALLIGFFSGGWLAEFFGWRNTFLILGLPGIVLALLAALTIREPRQQKRSTVRPHDGAIKKERAADEHASLVEVGVTLWSNGAYRHLLLACATSYFFTNGILQWQPTFFTRSHGLDSGELGTWFAAVYGVGGLIGTFAGGELAFRYAAGNERLQLAALGVVYVFLAAIGAAVYLTSDFNIAIGLLALSSIAAATVTGPMFAATQTLVPSRMRAMSIAIVLFFSNLIGLGLGPLAVGALSDVLRPAFGADSLRFALLALCPGYLWCAFHLWAASRSLHRSSTLTQAST